MVKLDYIHWDFDYLAFAENGFMYKHPGFYEITFKVGVN